MSVITTAVGSKLYIGGVHLDATDSVSEFAALTWVEVKNVRTVGRFGDKAALITYRTLGDSREHKLKGTRNAGALTIGCARNSFDPGQIAMAAAADTDFRYAIKYEAVDKADANDTPTIYYFGAFIMSNEEDYGDGSNVVGSDFMLEIDTQLYKVAAAVVP